MSHFLTIKKVHSCKINAISWYRYLVIFNMKIINQGINTKRQGLHPVESSDLNMAYSLHTSNVTFLNLFSAFCYTKIRRRRDVKGKKDFTVITN